MQPGLRRATRQFFATTTLHGFKYLCSSCHADRWCWLSGCAASAVCAGALCAVLWARFLQVPALLTVRSPLAAATPLPTVTVCLPPASVANMLVGHLSSDEAVVRRLILTFSHILQGKAAKTKNLVLLERLLAAHNVTVLDVLYRDMPPCRELAKRCHWQKEAVPCEQLFHRELTQYGVCCAMKPYRSSRASYGDDAVSYIQLKRDGNLCTVKAKICPEHKVHAKLYGVTLVVDEQEEAVQSMECHDCVASLGGCKHAIAFLMWVHRRSEEPSCTSIECYWMKSKLSRVGTTMKYISAKEMSNGSPSLPSNFSVLEEFLKEARTRKLTSCELLKYQTDYVFEQTENLSMHQLVLKYKESSCDAFLEKVVVTDNNIINVEKETRSQHESSLWHELRYGRITASRAYEFSRCKTSDGTLIALIMGGKLPDTPAMNRGRMLEDKVRQTVSTKLKREINKCGLMLSKKYPMIAGSPDGICDDSIVEIKCPMSAKTSKTYVSDGKPTQKYLVQVQLQMYLTGLKKGYYCVADCNYTANKIVDIINVTYDEEYVTNFLNVLVSAWKSNVYPLLYQSTQ